MLQPVNSVCIWKHVWRQRDRNFLISSHSDWLLCTKCNGLKAYHHCGERIISLHWGFHGSCSLNSQICFFTSFLSLLNTFFLRELIPSHCGLVFVEVQHGCCPPGCSFSLMLMDWNNLKKIMRSALDLRVNHNTVSLFHCVRQDG